jgi:nitroreductase
MSSNSNNNIQNQVLSIVTKRRSGNQFDETRSLKESDINLLIEAARWAPSCYGEEPWRFILCNKDTNKEAWDKLFNCLVEFNQGWAKNAPLLIVSLCKNNFTFNGQINSWGPYDTGAASMNLCNVACELGIMTHQMGGFDTIGVSKAFGINEDYTVVSVIAVGYEVQNPTDITERKRKPVEDIFFNGTFKN